MAATVRRSPATVPPITELTRIEPVYLGRLEKEGVFTTGILLEVAETPTRRQTLADHVGADTTDVLEWRDEALMLNLAAFGPDEHVLLAQAGITGLDGILALDLPMFQERIERAARALKIEPPTELTVTGWWEQARTLETPPEVEMEASSDIEGAILRMLLGLAVGVGGAALATAFGQPDSAVVSVLAVGAIMAIAGVVGRLVAPGFAGFGGLVFGSLVLLALLLGKSILIELPDTPLWRDQGIAFTLGLGAGLPGVIVGWVIGHVAGRAAAGRRATSPARGEAT
jgi:Domain of unknown function (DUF4332)